VAGVACLTDAVVNIIRNCDPQDEFFGIPFGASAGWELWLVAFAAAVLCVAATVVALQIAKTSICLCLLVNRYPCGTYQWRSVAGVAAVLIVIAGVVYAWIHPWNGDSPTAGQSPKPAPHH
jgi:hypothetical protein